MIHERRRDAVRAHKENRRARSSSINGLAFFASNDIHPAHLKLIMKSGPAFENQCPLLYRLKHAISGNTVSRYARDVFVRRLDKRMHKYKGADSPPSNQPGRSELASTRGSPLPRPPHVPPSSEARRRNRRTGGFGPFLAGLRPCTWSEYEH